MLKFFAYLNAAPAFDGRVTHFLNEYMGAHQAATDLDERRKLFAKTVGALTTIFGGEPVLRKGYGNTPLTMFEALMVAAGCLAIEGKEIRTIPIDVNDATLVANTTKGTNTQAALQRRVSRARALLEQPD